MHNTGLYYGFDEMHIKQCLQKMPHHQFRVPQNITRNRDGCLDTKKWLSKNNNKQIICIFCLSCKTQLRFPSTRFYFLNIFWGLLREAFFPEMEKMKGKRKIQGDDFEKD